MERAISKPITMIGDTGGRDFALQAVSFGNSSYIFSVEASQLVHEVSRSKREVDYYSGDPCVLMFTGENDDIVLVTEPIRYIKLIDASIQQLC